MQLLTPASARAFASSARLIEVGGRPTGEATDQKLDTKRLTLMNGRCLVAAQPAFDEPIRKGVAEVG